MMPSESNLNNPSSTNIYKPIMIQYHMISTFISSGAYLILCSIYHARQEALIILYNLMLTIVSGR